MQHEMLMWHLSGSASGRDAARTAQQHYTTHGAYLAPECTLHQTITKLNTVKFLVSIAD